MTPGEAYRLLTEVQKDYAEMVRELNAHKRLGTPVDPYLMPSMQRLSKGRRDLAMAAGLVWPVKGDPL
jgi:hypothetical protein